MAGVKVRIAGSDQVFDAPDGEDLLEVLQSHGYPIETGCGGVASCGLCRIAIEAGRELLSPLRTEERSHLGVEAQVLGMRLACQSKVRCRGLSPPSEVIVRVRQE
jgi:2Fe-2S ferredoxin